MSQQPTYDWAVNKLKLGRAIAFEADKAKAEKREPTEQGVKDRYIALAGKVQEEAVEEEKPAKVEKTAKTGK